MNRHQDAPVGRGRQKILSATVMLVAVGAIVVNAQTLLLASIHGYQRTLSPLAARAGIVCRFTPTCSRYAALVIERDGVLRGGARTIRRIARCGPWTTPGTRDDP